MQDFHQIEGGAKTPEELERILDIQIASIRARRTVPSKNRAATLAVFILLIFVFAGIALMMLARDPALARHGAHRTHSQEFLDQP